MTATRSYLICGALLLSLHACKPEPSGKNTGLEDAPASIRQVLDKQVSGWNEGDIEKFMDGYWKSDSLLFIGSKITQGWTSTLARYKKSYPGKEGMGTLRFEILRIDFIAADSYLVTGRYFLTRKKDNPSGIFTLLFEIKEGRWVIVYDHTS